MTLVLSHFYVVFQYNFQFSHLQLVGLLPHPPKILSLSFWIILFGLHYFHPNIINLTSNNPSSLLKELWWRLKVYYILSIDKAHLWILKSLKWRIYGLKTKKIKMNDLYVVATLDCFLRQKSINILKETLHWKEYKHCSNA